MRKSQSYKRRLRTTRLISASQDNEQQQKQGRKRGRDEALSCLALHGIGATEHSRRSNWQMSITCTRR